MKTTEQVYIYSMGKRLKITGIYDNDTDANKAMENSDNAVIATFEWNVKQKVPYGNYY